VYVFDVSDPTVTLTPTFSLSPAINNPLPNAAANHPASELTVQFEATLPLFDKFTNWPAGLLPPAVALKLREAGFTDKSGTGNALTIKVTVTTCGIPDWSVNVRCPV